MCCPPFSYFAKCLCTLATLSRSSLFLPRTRTDQKRDEAAEKRDEDPHQPPTELWERTWGYQCAVPRPTKALTHNGEGPVQFHILWRCNIIALRSCIRNGWLRPRAYHLWTNSLFFAHFERFCVGTHPKTHWSLRCVSTIYAHDRNPIDYKCECKITGTQARKQAPNHVYTWITCGTYYCIMFSAGTKAPITSIIA